MPQFCEVALPIALDATFTYRIAEVAPVIGGRVLVPLRHERLAGIVTELHDRPPTVQTKTILAVLDHAPVLDPCLMRLGRWIAGYYIAPLGEVFRTMLPLGAEFKRAVGYRISELGAAALASLESGPGLLPADSSEARELRKVLQYLSERDVAREEALRSATGATKQLLQSLLRRKWIARQNLSAVRDARRVVKVAMLCDPPPQEGGGEPCPDPNRAERSEGMSGACPAHESDKAIPFATQPKTLRALNPNQQKILEALQQSGGRAKVDDLRALELPATTLPSLVKRGLVEIVEEAADFSISDLRRPAPSLAFIFNPAQKKALEQVEAAVNARRFSVTLLHGVTGSGKTAVYLAAMQSVLASGRSAIMLVPEIGLTPAAAAQMHQAFGDQAALLHSALSDDERAEQWRRIRRGEARVVVGTRSAVFAPVADLALIVVDEEQDNSYKQDETPRYHGRDVAIMRGKMAGAAVLLGSATPSLESYRNATAGKYALLELLDRVERRPLPAVDIIDMRAEFQATGEQRVISRRLAEEIADRLGRGEQAMVLLNRRGYAPVVMCRSCGEVAQCRDCAISLTHHKRERRLMCHYCGYTQPVPRTCPACGSEYVYFLGTGSERLEELLHSMFPQARIARLDRDTVRGHHDFERVLNALHAGEVDLLVGTQMIAKGHDIHGVTLVGVVGADAALGFPDFRAAERTFQLLTQVAGRAGRGESPGRVILQTMFPEHYAVQFAARHDYPGFFDKELHFRSWMHYPPFTALANVLVRGEKLEDALKFAGLLGEWFKRQSLGEIRVLGPAAAPIVRLKRDYRYHFILKSPSREKLNTALRALLKHATELKISRANLIVDVDALALL